MATLVKVGLALVVGFVVFVVLVPTSGAGGRCFSLLSFQVSCEGAVAQAAGATTAVVAGVALWLMGRRAAS